MLSSSELQRFVDRLTAAAKQIFHEVERLTQVLDDYGPFVDKFRLIVGVSESGRAIVSIIGRPKQGKTALVRGLFGEPLNTALSSISTSEVASSVLLRVQEVHAITDVVIRVYQRKGVETLTSDDQLSDYASDQGNPNNEKGVSSVMVDGPANGRLPGVEVQDTPGFGWKGHHTEQVLRSLSMSKIAVLVSNKPLSSDELEYVARALEVNTKKCLYVYNWKFGEGVEATHQVAFQQQCARLADAGLSAADMFCRNVLHPDELHLQPLRDRLTSLSIEQRIPQVQSLAEHAANEAGILVKQLATQQTFIKESDGDYRARVMRDAEKQVTDLQTAYDEAAKLLERDNTDMDSWRSARDTLESENAQYFRGGADGQFVRESMDAFDKKKEKGEPVEALKAAFESSIFVYYERFLARLDEHVARVHTKMTEKFEAARCREFQREEASFATGLKLTPIRKQTWHEWCKGVFSGSRTGAIAGFATGTAATIAVALADVALSGGVLTLLSLLSSGAFVGGTTYGAREEFKKRLRDVLAKAFAAEEGNVMTPFTKQLDAAASFLKGVLADMKSDVTAAKNRVKSLKDDQRGKNAEARLAAISAALDRVRPQRDAFTQLCAEMATWRESASGDVSH